VLAETNTAAIALLVLGGLLLILSIVALVLRQRTKRREAEIPYALRPGPSDTALESPVLQRLQGWGLVMLVFLVVWFPVQWLLEPGRNLTQEEDLAALALERGALAVQPFTEENQLGVGCVRCHGPELKGGAIAFQGRYVNPPDLTNECARLTLEEIYTTIEEGRPDAGMPSWSIRFAGALTDQQINDIVVYIVSLNEDNVPFEQNKCINPEGDPAPSTEEDADAVGETPAPDASASAAADAEAA
jgi:mono/diheme cytochrome c family protein